MVISLREYNIYNKKGFTLLELIIAVSIFGIVSVMSFSIINFVPKLAKTESNQYSERSYVRRAVSEITGTIQRASSVANPPLVFTMPGGEEIQYEYNMGNVNKVVDGVPYRLMESLEEFSITPAENHLFDIHIKTSKEGKDYDFKVERRRGGNIKSNTVISSISPEIAVFDKNILFKQDVSINLDLNGNDLNGLRNDLNMLSPMADYSVSGNIVTIKKEYLAAQPNGTILIVFDVSNGVDPVLSLEIKDTSTNIKIAGNSYEDDLVRMEYPGNLKIDSDDNKWILTVINGTVANDFNENDLAITGLPSGISLKAAKGSGNTIVVTLSGTASAPVTNIKPVGIIIKGTGVNETSTLDSDSIEVFLLPGASFASPEHNLIFTNEIVIGNNVTISGDIVIGRGNTMTILGNNCYLYGHVYVDSSLTASNNNIYGKPDKETKVFVKGSAILGKVEIFGDLYYRDTLVAHNKFYASGEVERRAVEIPDISIPVMKPEQWYIDNGYTIVNNFFDDVELQDNGKYFFNTSYVFSENTSGLDNIIIVGTDDIIFSNEFSGSGIIFAPNGKIIFDNNCSFTGICVSKSTILNNNCILTFKRYLELPFD